MLFILDYFWGERGKDEEGCFGGRCGIAIHWITRSGWLYHIGLLACVSERVTSFIRSV